jgi:hypothetical protein
MEREGREDREGRWPQTKIPATPLTLIMLVPSRSFRF